MALFSSGPASTPSPTFTPSPWMWDSDPVKGDPYNRVRYRVVARGKTITQIYYSSYEGELTNAEADARLIAAAPDLHAALVALTNRYCALANSGDCGHWDPEAEDEMKLARAALSKALGQ